VKSYAPPLFYFGPPAFLLVFALAQKGPVTRSTVFFVAFGVGGILFHTMMRAFEVLLGIPMEGLAKRLDRLAEIQVQLAEAQRQVTEIQAQATELQKEGLELTSRHFDVTKSLVKTAVQDVPVAEKPAGDAEGTGDLGHY
jgi:septal ring factor EnvC (AmiA/AmiB activator)